MWLWRSMDTTKLSGTFRANRTSQKFRTGGFNFNTRKFCKLMLYVLTESFSLSAAKHKKTSEKKGTLAPFWFLFGLLFQAEHKNHGLVVVYRKYIMSGGGGCKLQVCVIRSIATSDQDSALHSGNCSQEFWLGFLWTTQ